MTSPIIPSGLGYLATPYSDFQPSRTAAFLAAAQFAGDLLRYGVVVVSPITHSHPIAMWGRIDPLNRAIWRKINRPLARACDYLIIGRLPGWDKSVGIAEEIGWFEAAKKPIYDCDQGSLTLTLRKYVPVVVAG